MSQEVFQALLGQLVTDPDFRDAVRRRGPAGLTPDLTERERQRLAAAASDPGIEITRTLHKSFRLGKLLAMLPLTCRLLGDERLADEVSRFWKQRPSLGFYFVDEALAFADHLAARQGDDLDVPYLNAVVGFERAALELGRPRPQSAEDVPATARVHFDVDPLALLSALAGGRMPEQLPPADCDLIALKDQEGQVRWFLRDADAVRPVEVQARSRYAGSEQAH